MSEREGNCLAAKLRPGNVHSTEGWEELLLPEIERQQEQGKEVVFRADAAFAKPAIYEALEARDVRYAIRLLANHNLERHIAELLTRSVGTPSYKPLVWLKSFLYQAASSASGGRGGFAFSRFPVESNQRPRPADRARCCSCCGVAGAHLARCRRGATHTYLHFLSNCFFL